MSKNVAVFVDVANIFYAAKAAGVDIDYVTLLKAASAGRDLVRAYAYTGLDPENENQRNFHDFLRRHGYRVVSKDIRKYGDGKVKANLDIELVVDMMKTARNLDVAIVVSGDGDFAPAIRAVQEMGVRVEVVSFRGNTSSDLMDVADQFTDITQVARVEKGSSRSGRRVAADDDLSMTEVPDKQSEGTGDRGRGRGRGRRTATSTTTRGRGRATEDRDVREPVAARGGGEPSLTVLPGEKLSRAASRPTAAEPDEELEDQDELEAAEGADEQAEGGAEDGRRRRRRRGGRGRGRGRGREGAVGEEDGSGDGAGSDEDAAEDDESAPAPARRAAASFGSVWDSQMGIQAGARRGPVVDDEEDLEEPAIPEYLLSERRQRDAGRGRGGRGRGGAYAAALERERFGGGRGSTPSRFAEPPRREGGYGRPDRDRDRGPRRDDRGGFRGEPRPAPRGGDEPWSEVPPEIEAMLRAQLGSRAAGDARRASQGRRPASDEVMDQPSEPSEPSETVEAAGVEAPPASRRRRTTRTAAADEVAGEAGAKATTRTARTRTPKAAVPETEATTDEAAPKPRTRTSRTGTASSGTSTRRTRTKATAAAAATESGEPVAAEGETAEAPAPKRRTTRRKADPAA